MVEKKRCSNCGKKKSVKKLFACKTCTFNPPYYCNQECQKTDWRFHAKYCGINQNISNPKLKTHEKINQSIDEGIRLDKLEFFTIKTNEGEYILKDFAEVPTYKNYKTEEFFEKYNRLEKIEKNVFDQSTSKIRQNEIFVEQIRNMKNLQKEIKSEQMYSAFEFAKALQTKLNDDVTEFYTKTQIEGIKKFVEEHKLPNEKKLFPNNLFDRFLGEEEIDRDGNIEFTDGIIKIFNELSQFVEIQFNKAKKFLNEEQIQTFDKLLVDIQLLHREQLAFVDFKYNENTTNDDIQEDLKDLKDRSSEIMPRTIDLFRKFNALSEIELNTIDANDIIDNKKNDPKKYRDMIDAIKRYDVINSIPRIAEANMKKSLNVEREAVQKTIEQLERDQTLTRLQISKFKETLEKALDDIENYENIEKPFTQTLQNVDIVQDYLVQNGFIRKFNREFSKQSTEKVEVIKIPSKSDSKERVMPSSIPQMPDFIPAAQAATEINQKQNWKSEINLSGKKKIKSIGANGDDDDESRLSSSALNFVRQKMRNFAETSIFITLESVKDLLQNFVVSSKILPESLRNAYTQFSTNTSNLIEIYTSDRNIEDSGRIKDIVAHETIINEYPDEIPEDIKNRSRSNLSSIRKRIIGAILSGLLIYSVVNQTTTDTKSNVQNLQMNDFQNGTDSTNTTNIYLDDSSLYPKDGLQNIEDLLNYLSTEMKNMTLNKKAVENEIEPQNHANLFLLTNILSRAASTRESDNLGIIGKSLDDILSDANKEILDNATKSDILRRLSEILFHFTEVVQTKEDYNDDERESVNKLIPEIEKLIQNDLIDTVDNDLKSDGETDEQKQQIRDAFIETIKVLKENIVKKIEENKKKIPKNVETFLKLFDAMTKSLISNETSIFTREYLELAPFLNQKILKHDQQSQNNYWEIPFNILRSSTEKFIKSARLIVNDLNETKIDSLIEKFRSNAENIANKLANGVDGKRLLSAIHLLDDFKEEQIDYLQLLMLWKIQNEHVFNITLSKTSSTNNLGQESIFGCAEGHLFDALKHLNEVFENIIDKEKLESYFKQYEKWAIYVRSNMNLFMLLFPLLISGIISINQAIFFPDRLLGYYNRLETELNIQLSLFESNSIVKRNAAARFIVDNLRILKKEMANIMNSNTLTIITESFSRGTFTVSNILLLYTSILNPTMLDMNFLVGTYMISQIIGSSSLGLSILMNSKVNAIQLGSIGFSSYNYDLIIPESIVRFGSFLISALSLIDQKQFDSVINNILLIQNRRFINPVATLAKQTGPFVLTAGSNIFTIWRTLQQIDTTGSLTRYFMLLIAVFPLLEAWNMTVNRRFLKQIKDGRQI